MRGVALAVAVALAVGVTCGRAAAQTQCPAGHGYWPEARGCEPCPPPNHPGRVLWTPLGCPAARPGALYSLDAHRDVEARLSAQTARADSLESSVRDLGEQLRVCHLGAADNAAAASRRLDDCKRALVDGHVPAWQTWVTRAAWFAAGAATVHFLRKEM